MKEIFLILENKYISLFENKTLIHTDKYELNNDFSLEINLSNLGLFFFIYKKNKVIFTEGICTRKIQKNFETITNKTFIRQFSNLHMNNKIEITNITQKKERIDIIDKIMKKNLNSKNFQKKHHSLNFYIEISESQLKCFLTDTFNNKHILINNNFKIK